MEAILTIGTSGSGKTTWAENFIKENTNWININRDFIRFNDILKKPNALWNEYKFNSQNESKVSEIFNNVLQYAYDTKMNIIISDTNLNENLRNDLIRNLEENGYTVKFEVFHIPFEKCVENDLKRIRSVGYNVIARQWKSFIDFNVKHMDFYKYSENKELSSCWIFDIDGTLAHMKNRNPFEWNKVGNDQVDESLHKIFEYITSNSSEKIFIFSGRDSICKEETEIWLKNNNFNNYELIMREQNNNEDDRIIKWEMFENSIMNKYNVLGIFDDRPKVCRMWRDHGLKVFQVGNPDIDF